MSKRKRREFWCCGKQMRLSVMDRALVRTLPAMVRCLRCKRCWEVCMATYRRLRDQGWVITQAEPVCEDEEAVDDE